MEIEINKNHKLIQEKGIESNIVKGKTLLMITPPIDENYWVARVHLYKNQYIIAFPKFFTYGIGFSQESNWNTNLPFQCSTDEICNHIWENHKYKAITKEQTIEAIKLLQEFCKNLVEE